MPCDSLSGSWWCHDNADWLIAPQVYKFCLFWLAETKNVTQKHTFRTNKTNQIVKTSSEGFNVSIFMFHKRWWFLLSLSVTYCCAEGSDINITDGSLLLRCSVCLHYLNCSQRRWFSRGSGRQRQWEIYSVHPWER